MRYYTTLEIQKEELQFSAGHFTIFSATERETLHGHNYGVQACFRFSVPENGLLFDYRDLKKALRDICNQIDRKFILPACSPFLKLKEKDQHVLAEFNRQPLQFLRQDVIILPITNSTIEELSQWFLNELTKDQTYLSNNKIVGIEIKIFNGPGQAAAARCGEC